MVIPKGSHSQLSSYLALSSHMLNGFTLLVHSVVENSDVNSYAMGLVATQRPKTKCFHLGRFCEWLCLLLLVGDEWPPFVRTTFACSRRFLLWLCSRRWKCGLFYMTSKWFNSANSPFESMVATLKPMSLVSQKLHSRFSVSKLYSANKSQYVCFCECTGTFSTRCFFHRFW